MNDPNVPRADAHADCAPFVARIGAALVECRRENERKTAKIAELEEKVRVLDYQLASFRSTANEKFTLWEKLLRRRWEASGDAELIAKHEAAYKEYFESNLRIQEDSILRRAEDVEDDDDVEVIGEKKASPASVDSGTCSRDDCTPDEPPKPPQAQPGPSGISAVPVQQVPAPLPLELTRTRQGLIGFIQGVPYLLPSNCYIEQPPTVVQPQPLLIHPVPAAPVQRREVPPPVQPLPTHSFRKRTLQAATGPDVTETYPNSPNTSRMTGQASASSSIDFTQSSTSTSASSEAQPDPSKRPRISPGTEISLNQATIAPVDAGHQDQAREQQPTTSNATPNQPQNSIPRCPPSDLPLPPPNTPETPAQASAEVQPSPASVDSSHGSMAPANLQKIREDPNFSPSSSAPSSPASAKRRRKHIPFKFDEKNSVSINVQTYNYAGIPRSAPSIHGRHLFKAKHQCHLSISKTAECGSVVNGRVREATVHVNYDMHERKNPVNLRLYYYMQSQLKDPHYTPKFIIFEKKIPCELSKFHVRFHFPESCPKGDVFVVTGHIGTSAEPHEMGELPEECISLPIDAQRPLPPRAF